jgi:predicted lysophospholipase L1 biosynthesis ABC-type transport system permease subunit
VNFDSLNDPELPSKIVERIDRAVGLVRDRTTKPLVVVIRGIVFGLMAFVGVLFVAVLALIALVRGLHSLFDLWWSREVAVWFTYLLLALVFGLIGGVLMRRRRPRKRT